MKNDDAVSPVVGVILMVAITVILAAIVAAFVFGAAGNIERTGIPTEAGITDISLTMTPTKILDVDYGNPVRGSPFYITTAGPMVYKTYDSEVFRVAQNQIGSEVIIVLDGQNRIIGIKKYSKPDPAVKLIRAIRETGGTYFQEAGWTYYNQSPNQTKYECVPV